MVAQGGRVVAGGVHQLRDGGALVHGAVGGALDGVAGIHQQRTVQRVFVAGHLGVGQTVLVALAHIVVDVGVDVVGIQDGDGPFLSGVGLCGADGDGQRQAQGRREDQGEQLGCTCSHTNPPFSSSFLIVCPEKMRRVGADAPTDL